MARLNKYESESAPNMEETEAASSMSDLALAFTRLAVAVEGLISSRSQEIVGHVVPSATSETNSAAPPPSTSAAAAAAVAAPIIDTCAAAPVTVPVVVTVPVMAASAVAAPIVAAPVADAPAAALVAVPAVVTASVVAPPAVAPPAATAPILANPTPTELAARISNYPEGGRWFLVTQGREPGIYPTWGETSPLVTGVSRAVHVRHNNREEALNGYMQAWLRNEVIRRL